MVAGKYTLGRGTMNHPQWRRLAVAGATAAVLLAAVPAPHAQITDQAQAQPATPYVVVMAADPAVAYDGGVPGLAPIAPDRGEKLNPDAPAVTEYVAHLEN